MQVQLDFGDATPQFLSQSDAALPFRRLWRYPRPNSHRPNGPSSLARSFAREVPVVSPSALTTFETIAIGHVALQDTSLRVAGANCHRSKTVTGENPASDWARHRRRNLGNARLQPSLYQVFQQ